MTLRCFAIQVLLSVAAVTNALTVNFFVDGKSVKSKEYLTNALILRSDLPDPALEADTVEFIGWTSAPFEDLRSEANVTYYDFTRKLTADISLYAVYAVKAQSDNGFSLVTSRDEVRAGDLYLFADFAAEDASDKHLMSVNLQGNFGFLPSDAEIVFRDGKIVPSADVFVARLTDIPHTGRCRFALYGSDRVLALNDGSTSSTFRYVGCANPMPILGSSNAGLLSYFNISVSQNAQVRMWADEKATAHFALAALSRNGYTYNVFHNTSLTAPLYLYRQKRDITRVTLFASQPPLSSAVSTPHDSRITVADGVLNVSLSASAQLTITDMLGRVLISAVFDAGQHFVPLPGLRGVYVVRVGCYSQKIVL